MRLVALAMMLSTTGVGACRPTVTARTPVDPTCRADRVGKVTIAGGSAHDVAQLAVLEGTLDDAARTERVRLAAIDVLHTRGYPRAYVAVTRREGCGVELDVAVVPGPRVRIVAIEFEANDAFPSDARLATIEDALGTVNAVGGAYVEDRLYGALAELQARYRAAGWLDAIVEPPHAEVDESRGTVRVTITIHAGRRT
jgi:outer membrane protein assembly factor BamA